MSCEIISETIIFQDNVFKALSKTTLMIMIQTLVEKKSKSWPSG